jgi:DNA-directed RNA polymerase subunit RPC12/RpoP
MLEMIKHLKETGSMPDNPDTNELTDLKCSECGHEKMTEVNGLIMQDSQAKGVVTYTTYRCPVCGHKTWKTGKNLRRKYPI